SHRQHRVVLAILQSPRAQSHRRLQTLICFFSWFVSFCLREYSFASSDNDRQGVWPVTIFLSAHSLSLGSFRAKSTNLSILIWDMSRDYNLRMCSILNGNQPTGLWVRRLACGCDPGGVTSRDFSTSLEMTR